MKNFNQFLTESKEELEEGHKEQCQEYHKKAVEEAKRVYELMQKLEPTYDSKHRMRHMQDMADQLENVYERQQEIKQNQNNHNGVY